MIRGEDIPGVTLDGTGMALHSRPHVLFSIFAGADGPGFSLTLDGPKVTLHGSGVNLHGMGFRSSRYGLQLCILAPKILLLLLTVRISS